MVAPRNAARPRSARAPQGSPRPIAGPVQAEGGGARVAVAPHKFARGFDGTARRRAPLLYRVMPLVDALVHRYETDAHLVTYVVEGASRQPRINKAGLPYFGKSVQVEAFFCDVDNPGHMAWDARSRRSALARVDRLETLRSVGVYFTQHGLRFVQPLSSPLPVTVAERVLGRWLGWLEASGLEVDWACRDWTRHFRLPNVVRDGERYDSPLVLLDRMAPVSARMFAIEEPPYPDSPAHPGVSVAEPGAPWPAPSFDWAPELDPALRPHVERIARRVRQVETEWHSLFLAIAGALLSCGAEPEELPLLCRSIALATGADDRPDDRARAGRSTAERYAAGLPVVGLGALRRRWPAVAEAFEPPPPMRFRELTRALDALGGSRAMAALLGWQREDIVRLLEAGVVTGEQARQVRAAVEARRSRCLL